MKPRIIFCLRETIIPNNTQFNMFGVGVNENIPAMELKVLGKVVPEHISDDTINEFIKDKPLRADQYRAAFTDFDEWEDFDRMKHMTEEQRQESDKMSLGNDIGNILNNN